MKATRQQLLNLGASILSTAYEGGSCGLASWAVANGTYEWGTEQGLYELDGNNHFASVTLYDREACELVEDEAELAKLTDDDGFNGWGGFYRFGKPLVISDAIIADFIEKIGTGEFSQDNVPDYGQLRTSLVSGLAGSYLQGEDACEDFECEIDAIDADNIVQFILLGEVTYG
jgi:hypothetical protein